MVLKDETKGVSIRLKGKYSGTIIPPDFNKQKIELEEGVDKKVLMDELPSAAW